MGSLDTAPPLHALWGPFKSPDEIKDKWYLFAEEELVGEIREVKAEIKEYKRKLGKAGKAEKESWKKDLASQKQWLHIREQDLKNLREFVENYQRLLERYKFDKKALKQIQRDWHDYNNSLYSDWHRIRAMGLDPQLTKGPELKAIQRETKGERIKREEIERRFRELLH